MTRQHNGSETLQDLERRNFFVVPLDDKRQWYRYHHLFSAVLRAFLTAEQPERVTVLHRRASEWCEQNGWPADAIHHALAARDFERAASLIELAMPALRQSRQAAIMLSWLRALPDALLLAGFVLFPIFAWEVSLALRLIIRGFKPLGTTGEAPRAQLSESVERGLSQA